jgi:geranylgeranyl diphosphate synthase type I
LINDNSYYIKKFDSLKSAVNNELNTYFEKKLKECSDDEISQVINVLKDFTMNGGKRVRPIIMILGYNIFRDIDDKIIRASTSIELAQSYLLIHDDIMDESDIRRGKPSFHKHFENKIKNRKIAENIAISAGDLIDTFSHEVLLKSGFNEKDLLNADYEFSKVIEDTGKGQLLDLFSTINETYSEEKLLKLHYFKTARYTIEGPMVMGSFLAGNYDYTQNIREFGKNAGIAFQLYDDILGMFGDEAKTGKSIKSDVNEGKKTLLIIKAYENSNDLQRSFIEKCIKSGNVSDDDFNKLKKIIIDTGSYDYSLKKIDEFTKIAKQNLKSIRGSEEPLEMLEFLSNYIIHREN